jgi:protein FAM32A
MGDYDFKPSGSLKLKGVKDKKIKKQKKDKSKTQETTTEEDDQKSTFILPKTEAERRFEEIQRQRVNSLISRILIVDG